MSASNPSSADISAKIARLFIYPIKSCAGVEVQEALLTETGFDLDRAWMVVDEAGEFVSQREIPRMVLIRPEFTRLDLILRAPGMLSLHLHIDSVEQPKRVRVWDDEVDAFDMGDVAAQWFTDFLSLSEQGLPIANAPKFRLVRFDPEFKRISNLQWTGGVEARNQFSDGFPLLVLGQASHDELSARLKAAGHTAVGIERFRPNIVLEGLSPHDEDRLGDMLVAADLGAGDDTAAEPVVLRPVKPCPRCPIPNIDPTTAQSSPEVSDALQAYRSNPIVNGALSFGMNAIVLKGEGAMVRVGQTVSANFKFE